MKKFFNVSGLVAVLIFAAIWSNQALAYGTTQMRCAPLAVHPDLPYGSALLSLGGRASGSLDTLDFAVLLANFPLSGGDPKPTLYRRTDFSCNHVGSDKCVTNVAREATNVVMSFVDSNDQRRKARIVIPLTLLQPNATGLIQIYSEQQDSEYTVGSVSRTTTTRVLNETFQCKATEWVYLLRNLIQN